MTAFQIYAITALIPASSPKEFVSVDIDETISTVDCH